MLAADPRATAARVDELRGYMDAKVLGPGGFCCNCEPECKPSIRQGDRFFEGQLSHVGRHYDLMVDGVPLRVVIVGQEYGRDRSLVTLYDRYTTIHDDSGLGRRYYSDGIHRGRNPHMRGTTSALRVVFGRAPADDWDSEFLDADGGQRFHIFDAFALVNVLLCSAGPSTGSRGHSTRVMRRNCAKHFERTLRILEPTLLILQGKGVQSWIKPMVKRGEEVAPNLLHATVADVPVLMCTFSHPSAMGALRWGANLDAPYLTDVVVPTLQRAVRVGAPQ